MRIATAATLLLVISIASAFTSCPLSRTARPIVASKSTLDASPLDNIFALLKGGKLGLVKSLAGDFDEAAIKSKLDGLIEKNSVLMLSFTT